MISDIVLTLTGINFQFHFSSIRENNIPKSLPFLYEIFKDKFIIKVTVFKKSMTNSLRGGDLVAVEGLVCLKDESGYTSGKYFTYL